MTYFPEEVVEHIVDFLGSHRDRNAMSTVCKAWYQVERLSRRNVFVGNCYAIRPERVMARFPWMKSLSVKGKPHFADFNLVPYDWGGFAQPWIEAAARGCPGLEELRLKRMVVTDDDLELLARSFPNFKSLVLVSCEGFSTDGLAAIATYCRGLRELDLQENEVEDHGHQWLSCFPDSCTSLISLNFACLKGEVNANALERLVARCPDLRSLKLNRAISVESLNRILTRAPHLVDLGTGSMMLNHHTEAYHRLINTFLKCKSLRSLSGFCDASSCCLQAVYPVCMNLTALNLSYAPAIQGDDLIKLICLCFKLQKLWVLDCIGDKGLAAVASACKDLQELRVFPSDIYGAGTAAVTEEELPTFHAVQIMHPRSREARPGLLTDKVFLYIGMHAEHLEMLSIAFAGDSDKGMVYVLNGCKNLRKLEIRDCPFGDDALLKDVTKYETMRSLWMSSCDVTLGGCRALAAKMPSLNVEIINESDEANEFQENFGDLHKVEKLYVYRTVGGGRTDAPDFVWIL
ncbi:hypothetical protein OPV22_019697 [Ensete ventricosum]|uniref:F-box domain-containing protein n=1 Tax=Ensete ventricosum TaxID=4639 RepID=A0AAV8P9I7_ENSVE|nr:hypothetical protein OPV22_019697 [Ensete ventricosum]